MPNPSLLEHVAESTLERYLLHQSSDSEIELIETHFLACSRCTTSLERLELQILATKIALQEIHQEKVAQRVQKQKAKRLSWFSLSSLSAASALAALLLTFSISATVNSGKNEVATVELNAYRSVESPVLPANREVHLVLNTGGGLDGSLAQVVLVDSNGHQIWKTVSRISHNLTIVDVPKIRLSGGYYFRVLTGDGNGEPLREFAVTVE